MEIWMGMQLRAVLFVTSIALSRHPKEALLTSVMMALVATQYYFLILTSFSTYPFEPRRHHMWVMCTQSLMIDDDDFSLQQLAFLVDHHDNEVPVPSRFFQNWIQNPDTAEGLRVVEQRRQTSGDGQKGADAAPVLVRWRTVPLQG